MTNSIFTKEEQKDILKEALQEWLDKKFAQFGMWVLGSILATVFVALVILAVKFQIGTK